MGSQLTLLNYCTLNDCEYHNKCVNEVHFGVPECSASRLQGYPPCHPLRAPERKHGGSTNALACPVGSTKQAQSKDAIDRFAVEAWLRISHDISSKSFLQLRERWTLCISEKKTKPWMSYRPCQAIYRKWFLLGIHP